MWPSLWHLQRFLLKSLKTTQYVESLDLSRIALVDQQSHYTVFFNFITTGLPNLKALRLPHFASESTIGFYRSFTSQEEASKIPPNYVLERLDVQDNFTTQMF